MKSKSLWMAAIPVFASCIAACTSVSTNLPSTRFESPEVPGHLTSRVALGGGTTQSVVYTNDASARPVVLNESFSNYAELPLVKASLGLGDQFEIGMRYGFPGALIAKGKFQILGSPAIEHKDGNFALAITAGLGIEYSGEGGNQEGTFGPGGYNWNAYTKTTIYDVALIAGIRTSEHFIVFVSPFYTSYNLTGNIGQALSDNGQSPGTSVSLTGSGSSYGGSLGAQLSLGQKKKWSLMADLTIQNLQWSIIGNQGALGGGLLCEFMF